MSSYPPPPQTSAGPFGSVFGAPRPAQPQAAAPSAASANASVAGSTPGLPSASASPAATPSAAGLDKQQQQQQASGAADRPEGERARLINMSSGPAFPGPFSPSAPLPKHDPHASEAAAAVFRGDGRFAGLTNPAGAYPDPASGQQGFHPDAAAWSAAAAAEKEREGQQQDKDSKERDKLKRTQQIEVLNRPAFVPPAVAGPQVNGGAHQPLPPPSVDVKMEPQPQQMHNPLHPLQPPPPTSNMRGGPVPLSSSRNRIRPHGTSLTPNAFTPGGGVNGGGRAELDPASLASPPNPSVCTPFLQPTLSKDAPFLGRFVYGGARWLFPSDVSRKGAELSEAPAPGQPNGSGGKIEVIIPNGYLGCGWAVSLRKAQHERQTTPDGPAQPQQQPSGADGTPKDAESAGWQALLEGVNCERRVWGTEVYTDDSDLIGVLVHSGWLVPAFSSTSADDPAAVEASSGKRKRPVGAGLRVSLRVVGRLLRFVGTERNGVRSRGWGNGHDGASIIVEDVAVIDAAKPPTLSRRTKRPRVAQLLQMRSELAAGAPMETLSLNIFGGGGYKYTPAALMEAMELSEIEPPDEEELLNDGASGQPPLYKKLRPDLQDSDLLLENAEERYRLRLDSSGSSLLSIRYFPKPDANAPSLAPAPGGPLAVKDTADDAGEPLGAGLVRQRDLEWVEGGLIVREALPLPLPPSSDGAQSFAPQQQQQHQQQHGWFCKIARWWWVPRPAGLQTNAALRQGTISEWVQQQPVSAAPISEAEAEGSLRETGEKAAGASAGDVAMDG